MNYRLYSLYCSNHTTSFRFLSNPPGSYSFQYAVEVTFLRELIYHSQCLIWFRSVGCQNGKLFNARNYPLLMIIIMHSIFSFSLIGLYDVCMMSLTFEQSIHQGEYYLLFSIYILLFSPDNLHLTEVLFLFLCTRRNTNCSLVKQYIMNVPVKTSAQYTCSP